MTPNERHALVTRIFLEVAALPEAERAAVLDDRCGDDPELRAEVERMLEQDRAEGAPIDDPALGPDFELEADDPAGASDGSNLPERIGDFRILELLGAGSTGVVYLAEQEQPRRRVALKVLRPGPVSERTLRRFEREAEILARLQHPGIAHVLATGVVDSGFGPQPYFAMEYVEGRLLLEHVSAAGLDVRHRLDLLLQLCDAVQHAHQRGVIHRDLKPGNVLVTESGHPKILDFGVARITDGDVGTMTLHTELGQLIGTVPYMSPEQAAGDVDAIDTRSDVYALGVIGFELLSGRLPYELQGKMVHEAARIICEEDPGSLSSVDRSLRGDLDAVLAKALEKDKTRRYQSASELAADIRRYLNDETVEARSSGPLLRLRKSMRRHRVLSAVVITAALTLVVGACATTWQAIVASRERDKAVTAQQLADERTDQLLQASGPFARTLSQYLVNSPVPVEQRKQLVEVARTFLRSVVGVQPDDRDMLVELIYAHQPVAQVQYSPAGASLGDIEGALQTHGEIIALSERLIEGWPDFPGGHFLKAQHQHAVAVIHRFQGSFSESLQLARAAREAAVDLAPRYPDKPHYARLIHMCDDEITDALSALGDEQGAAEAFQRSLELKRELAGRRPDDWLAQSDLIVGLNGLGRRHMEGGDYQDAIDVFTRRRELVESALERFGNLGFLRRQLASVHDDLAQAYAASGDPDKMLQHFRSAAGIFDAISEADPRNYTATRDAFVPHFNLAMKLRDLAKIDEALDAAGEAVDAATRLYDLNAEDGSTYLGSALSLQSQLLIAAGEIDQAVALATDASDMVERVANTRDEDVRWQMGQRMWTWNVLADAHRAASRIESDLGTRADHLERALECVTHNDTILGKLEARGIDCSDARTRLEARAAEYRAALSALAGG